MARVRDILGRRKRYSALEPDEIFMDAENVMSFDTAQLEGRIERPLSERTYSTFLIVALLIGAVVLLETLYLTVFEGPFYASWAEDNRLRHDSLIAERGLITDRTGIKLATNTAGASSTEATALYRSYPYGESTAHLVGYVSYPKRDSSGVWYQDETVGIAGAEALYNDQLRGQNGTIIQEINASGDVVSGSELHAPVPGTDVVLSIDADLQKKMYDVIKERVDASFIGGAGAIMDIETGELYALVSYPSFDPEVMSLGKNQDLITSYATDTRAPFVDRGVSGLYTPGSIVKPFIALAALSEGVVTPQKTFYSDGRLVVPNPFNPDKPSIFRDWRAHGTVDMRRAIAVSSDVYFYIVGGGFNEQRGLGISNINSYARMFGFGEPTGFPLEEEPAGVVPNPEWKTATFDESVWRVGDTYNTAIGQYGWQVTLLQAVRATAALANGGTIVTPTIRADDMQPTKKLEFDDADVRVVHEGMRQAVTEGTATSLSIEGLRVAGKTGTAETGARKEFVNSLVIGYFPYEKPRFAFALILERARAGTLVGAPATMRPVLEWIRDNRPTMIK